MADPLTLASISTGTTVLGSVLGAIGASTSGEANAQMYSYQAGVARINQQIAKQNADYSRATGEVEAQASGIKSRQQIGQIKTAQAASGLDVNRGSAAIVRESQGEVAAQDQAMIRANAAHRAYGYDVEAAQQEAQGNLAEMAASKSRTAGTLGAVSSILGGATSVAGKWLDAKRVGIGTSEEGGSGVG